MYAMILDAPGKPLRAADIPIPVPGPGQVLIRVLACGVCRTDLHVVDGELTEPVLPLIPGHQIVGMVTGVGRGVSRFSEGDRVGVPWLGSTCDECRHCHNDRENLCDNARFTGYQINGVGSPNILQLTTGSVFPYQRATRTCRQPLFFVPDLSATVL